MKKILPFLILAYAVFAANEYTPTYGPVGTNEFTPAYDSGDEEAGVTQFTVSYNANGGTGSAASQTLDSNSSVTLSTGGTIARAEYVLDKWNTAANGSGTDYALGGTLNPLIADVTLYAQWVWDTLEVYGIRQDTARIGDSIAIGWHCPNFESATVTTGATSWTVLGTTNADTLRLIVPSIAADSFYVFSICDEVSCDTTADSIFIASNPVSQFTLTVAHTGNGSTTGGGTVDSSAETAITATADAHNHFLRWSVTSGTATITDASSASTTVRCHSNATVSAAFGLDTHYLAYTITGGNAAVTFLDDSIAAYGETIRAYLSVNAGYRATWPGGVLVSGNDTLDVLMTKDSTLSVAVFGIPLVDSIRPGPKANRNDSCTARGVRFTNGGVVRNITAGDNAVQKSWTATQIDFYTSLTWPRGWNTLVFTNSDSLRDTGAVYITIPRKTN